MSRSSYFTGSLYARMAEDLHLAGMAERTHAGYLRAVRKLADYCRTSPDKISEDQLRRFFLHMKNEVRYYGWMSPHSKIALDEVSWLVWLVLGWTYWLASGHAPQREPNVRQPLRCSQCGGPLRIVGVLHSDCRVLVEHSLAYLDSG